MTLIYFLSLQKKRVKINTEPSELHANILIGGSCVLLLWQLLLCHQLVDWNMQVHPYPPKECFNQIKHICILWSIAPGGT